MNIPLDKMVARFGHTAAAAGAESSAAGATTAGLQEIEESIPRIRVTRDAYELLFKYTHHLDDNRLSECKGSKNLN